MAQSCLARCEVWRSDEKFGVATTFFLAIGAPEWSTNCFFWGKDGEALNVFRDSDHLVALAEPAASLPLRGKEDAPTHRSGPAGSGQTRLAQPIEPILTTGPAEGWRHSAGSVVVSDPRRVWIPAGPGRLAGLSTAGPGRLVWIPVGSGGGWLFWVPAGPGESFGLGYLPARGRLSGLGTCRAGTSRRRT